MFKKALQLAIFSSIIWSATIAPTVNANFYNFGTLDVRPVQEESTQNTDWFIKYLKPGEKIQEKIQISNFGPQEKELTIYATDTSVNENTNFYTKSYESPSTNIAKWISLPTNNITLKSGESKILSVNFKPSTNAGVGMHTGAIIVRENHTPSTDTQNSMIIEKGIRVYMNITGEAITKGNITNVYKTETSNTYGINIQTRNTGTTDLYKTYDLTIKNVLTGKAQTATDTSRIEPRTTALTTLTTEKPTYGIYNLHINIGEESIYVKTVIFIPLWALFTMLAILTLLVKRKTPNTNWELVINKLKAPEFQKTIAYLVIVTTVSTSVFVYKNTNDQLAKAQESNKKIEAEKSEPKEDTAKSYELTIKWGDFRKILAPKTTKKQWHGRIYFPNSRIKTTNLLHFERNDQAEIVGDKTALKFNLTTGPDNDGITIYVEPTSNKIPIVKYEDYDTKETFEFPITKYINSAGIYPSLRYATYFKTDYGKEEKMRQEAIKSDLLKEIEATEEQKATQPAGANIPELENLFVEELPATPEALSEFIMDSDYVEKVTKEENTHKIETDNILIKALEATPEVLQEIAATEDLNFIFLPSETITFPAQEFSFKNQKESTQDLGTMIFVQNKNTPWNTFIGTTDFQLLSGGKSLPASALTIDPGEATMLTKDGAKVTTGKEEKINNKNDKLKLVDVTPKANKNEVFVLNPKLHITIPPGTTPGTYRGQLTITSL